MSRIIPSWQALTAIALCLIAMFLPAMTVPEAQQQADPTITMNYP